MINVHLCEQRRHEVYLRAESRYFTSVFYSTACPDDRNSIAKRLMVLQVRGVREAMVGYEDEQRLVPCRGLTERAGKSADTTVGISNGIEVRVFEMGRGRHLKGLMTAERKDDVQGRVRIGSREDLR